MLTALILILLRIFTASFLFILMCYGYGDVVFSFLKIKVSRWLYIVAGLVLFLGFGGLLTLAGIADFKVLFVLVLSGSCLAIWEMRGRRIEIQSKIWSEKYSILLLLAVIGLMASTLGGFHETADKVGYAVNLVRQLQTGRYGPDPFNVRITQASLGGNNFLLTAVSCVGMPFYQLRALERVIACVITMTVVRGLGKEWGISRRHQFLTAISVIVLWYWGIGGGDMSTLTGSFIGVPVYLFFIWLSYRLETNEWKGLAVLGATVAAGFGLKGIHIPGFVLVVFFFTMIGCNQGWRFRMIRIGGIAVYGLVFLLSWMVNLKMSADTFLYPILGLGYHGSHWGQSYRATLISNLKEPGVLLDLMRYYWTQVPLIAIQVVMIFQFGVFRRQGKTIVASPFVSVRFWTAALLSLLTCPAILVLAISFARYATAVTVFSVLLTYMAICVSKTRTRNFDIALTALAALWIGFNSFQVFDGIRDTFHDARYGFRLENFSMREPITKTAVHNAQLSVPAGSRIVARMGQAYFLDFERNPIWHIDIPGESSLPPGLPLKEGPAELAKYFRDRGVRYVMYSSADDGGHPIGKYLKWTRSSNPWKRITGPNIVAFDKETRRLGLYSKIIFEKDGIVVFDLSSTPITPTILRRGKVPR